MMLLIDAGNTRSKAAWLDPVTLTRQTPALTLEDSHLANLAHYLPQPPTHILGSNVAGPAAGQRLNQACLATWGVSVHWCDTRAGHTLLSNPYTPPGRLGSDRWLGLLGLLQHLQADPAWQNGHPALLASFGTATTIDTLMPPPAQVDCLPTFLGGLIFPGPSLMLHSLAQGTAQLPLAAGHLADFPQNTHDAISSGVAAAQAGALMRQWQLARDLAHGRPPIVFISGGGWPMVADEVRARLAFIQHRLSLPPGPVHVLDSPVLDGLALLASQGDTGHDAPDTP
jgi:type III pantothenate kinase